MKKKFNIPIIGAVLTALLSTLCCLPAFLFIFFGISSGFLTTFTNLGFIRVPLGILTIILLFYGVKKYNAKIKCECEKKNKIASYVVIFFIFLFVGFILFYPELIPMFME